MSTEAAAFTAPVGAREASARPTLRTLTLVELRKMADTRAGFWLGLVTIGLTIVSVVIACAVGHAEDQAFRSLLEIAVAPSMALLPIVGILLVTSEFSQRTALVTFALVPRRSRVLVAKILASVSLSLIALAVCLPVAAIGTAVTAPAAEHPWALPVGMLGQTALALVAAMLTGVAFGAVLLNSAPAIVLSFVVPMVWAVLVSLPRLGNLATWLDGSRSLEPLTDHIMSLSEWAHAGATLVVWAALPLLIGAWRIARHEIT